jgi:hypothetical protein
MGWFVLQKEVVWKREEALAAVTTVQMMDLPPESQVSWGSGFQKRFTLFQNCFKIVSKMFRNCFEMFQNCFKIVSKFFSQNVFAKCFKRFQKVLEGMKRFQNVAARRGGDHGGLRSRALAPLAPAAAAAQATHEASHRRGPGETNNQN